MESLYGRSTLLPLGGIFPPFPPWTGAKRSSPRVYNYL
ncbi:hypothetical protein CJD_A0474 [Clostridium perfringens D str. JGS1721]|uniref:Uncharacterized protein n=1 Tax=Clostridium perfringens D str. JGS1721 TaxID=488537 RepID=B1V338_CLOPF|nr:hypothetical protein CJD_A0474 [Clostridium perfringens D str. JGS1721]